MSELKILEMIAESDSSWEDAVQQALVQAKTVVSNIQSIYVKEFLAVVKNDEIVNFKVNAKLTFLADE